MYNFFVSLGPSNHLVWSLVIGGKTALASSSPAGLDPSEVSGLESERGVQIENILASYLSALCAGFLTTCLVIGAGNGSLSGSGHSGSGTIFFALSHNDLNSGSIS